MFVCSYLLAHPLALAFTGYDAELLAFTENAFRIYSCAFLFFGFTMFGSSTFTALGNGTVSAVIAFFHAMVFEVGSVLLLPMLFGPSGIWWAYTVAEVAATVLTGLLLLKFGPRRVDCGEPASSRERIGQICQRRRIEPPEVDFRESA